MATVRTIPRDTRDVVGEGALWCADRNALFWVDIMAPALRQLDLATGCVSSWTMPDRIGWVLEREASSELLIGLKSGFATLSLDPFAIHPIGNPEPERVHNRLNDAKVDRWGRVWAGSKDDRDQEATGALYRLDSDLRWSRMDDGYHCTNGPAFSPDGHLLYHVDSGLRTVYVFDLSEDGTLSNKREFLRFEADWGYPDGLTTDAKGGIWIAHWAGARISRFSADGTFDRSISLPAANVSSIAFAGSHLDRMFVTSATHGTSDDAYAGALFEVLGHGAEGLPMRKFAG